MIIYKKGSLFDAPRGSLLVHGCNARGVWGSGIAVEFKHKFPEAYEAYKQFCELNGAGTAFLTPEEDSYTIGCLITSEMYGQYIDPPEIILENTKSAIEDLLKQTHRIEIHSNKFNSGLFRVDWRKTAKIIQDIVDTHQIDWYVWSP